MRDCRRASALSERVRREGNGNIAVKKPGSRMGIGLQGSMPNRGIRRLGWIAGEAPRYYSSLTRKIPQAVLMPPSSVATGTPSRRASSK